MTLPPNPRSVAANADEPPTIDLRRPITHTTQIIDLTGPTIPFDAIRNTGFFEIEDLYTDTDEADNDELSDNDDEGSDSGYDSDETIPYISLESICDACEVYKRSVLAHARLIIASADPPAPDRLLNDSLQMVSYFGDFNILRALRVLNLGADVSQNIALSLFNSLRKKEDELMRFMRTNRGVRAQFSRDDWRRLTTDLRPRTRARASESSDEEDRQRPRQRLRFT